MEFYSFNNFDRASCKEHPCKHNSSGGLGEVFWKNCWRTDAQMDGCTHGRTHEQWTTDNRRSQKLTLRTLSSGELKTLTFLCWVISLLNPITPWSRYWWCHFLFLTSCLFPWWWWRGNRLETHFWGKTHWLPFAVTFPGKHNLMSNNVWSKNIFVLQICVNRITWS